MKRIFCLLLAAVVMAGCGAPRGAASEGENLPAVSSSASLASQASPAATEMGGAAFHFSVDDVISVFVELHVNADSYTSMFEQPTLAFLKKMHDKYGMVVSLYAFYESYDGGFDLSQCTSRYAEEFAQNADWLRVGFHARADAPRLSQLLPQQVAGDYGEMMRELERICGAAAIDPVPRLHWWDADEERLAAMMAQPNGLKGLLAGRRESDENYHLPPSERQALFADDFLPGASGLFYTPTDLWLEEEADLTASLEALLEPGAPGLASGLVVAFTHEYAMGDPVMHGKIEQCAQFAKDNAWGFAFPLDHYSAQGIV